MSRNKKPTIDPVIVIALGVVFLTISIVMIVFQSNNYNLSLATNSSALSQLTVAFITGLTTGGLSCLAVQGGLLASSLAHQIEQDFSSKPPKGGSNAVKRINGPRGQALPFPFCSSWSPRLLLIRF